MQTLTRLICSMWEVSDWYSEKKVTAIVSMSLSPTVDGEVGKMMTSHIERSSALLRHGISQKVIFSNRFIAGGKSIAELERDKALECGLYENQIVIPDNPRDPKIRNTFEEARFAIESVEKMQTQERKSILVVANHLHTRRVLGAFRRHLLGTNITLYWQNVCIFEDYGPEYAQKRFRHPLFFLAYEILAVIYSRYKGWM